MQDILMRATCFVAIIFLGFILRKRGFFGEDAFPILSKMVIHLTLPASLIASFSTLELDTSLLTIIPLGLGSGVLYILLAYVTQRKKGGAVQGFTMINLSGCNIGTFTLPFVLSFMGPMGIAATSLFDVGNAAICLGLSYSCASSAKDGTGFDWKRLARTLLHSTPFVCYVLVITLNLLHVPFPKPIVQFSGIVGGANAFLAMLMIGVGFHLSADRRQLSQLARILLLRYSVAVLLALSFYFLLPFSLEIRKTLVLLCFSPIPSMAPAFTAELGEDVGLSSAISSLSIVISMVLFITVLTVLG